MSRISIDVTPEEHRKLKALAALDGKSIKEFVLERTLAANDASQRTEAQTELESLLDERIREAEAGAVSERTVKEVFSQAYREADNGPDV